MSFILVWNGFANAAEQEFQPGPFNSFDYCAPPVRPSCLDDARAFQSAKSKTECEVDENHYISSVFAYRACMYSQIESVIRETNAASALFKCREAGLTACP
jgi:hypothetical protein